MNQDSRTHDLTILNEVAQALNESVDLDDAMRAALAKSAELLELHVGWIWLLNEETGKHYLAASQDLPPGLRKDPGQMEGWCRCVEDYLDGELDRPANVDVITCTRLKALLAGTDGLRYHASVPLHAYGKQIGILNVASTDWRELDGDKLSLLDTIGDMLGIAVERARLYARSLQLGAESERVRLAREIHDSLAQGFSAIALRLETADALLEASVEADEVRPSIEAALLLARDYLDDARRSVLDLRAAPLAGKSLPAALAELVATVEKEQNVAISFAEIGASRPLPANIEVGLFRVAQEAIANAVRHANAQQIRVTLIATPISATVDVSDDGDGFDSRESDQDRFGLVGMNERALLLGGTLSVQSAHGQGTQIEVVVPLAGDEGRTSNG